MKVEAVYEDGVLKLRSPLPIPDHTQVLIEVAPANDQKRLPTLPRDEWERALGAVALGGDALADSEAYYDVLQHHHFQGHRSGAEDFGAHRG
jgi:predicted DNA-binding antitoxin AbrB/MazE fold protein